MKRSKGKASKRREIIGDPRATPNLTVVPDPPVEAAECLLCHEPLTDMHEHSLDDFHKAVDSGALVLDEHPVPDAESLGGRCDNCRSWMGSWNPSYLDGEYCAHCVPLPV